MGADQGSFPSCPSTSSRYMGSMARNRSSCSLDVGWNFGDPDPEAAAGVVRRDGDSRIELTQFRRRDRRRAAIDDECLADGGERTVPGDRSELREPPDEEIVESGRDVIGPAAEGQKH